MGHGGEFWQNMVHRRRECQTTSAFFPWEPHVQYEKAKKIGQWKMNSPGWQVPNMLLEKSEEITAGRMKRWSQSENNAQLWMSLVMKVQCYKDRYWIGTWNVRSMNQGKLEVVKHEMSRVNINILGISLLKWTRMGKFNSDDHYIYYCVQESLEEME